MRSQLNHIAFVVKSIEEVIKRNPLDKAEKGEIEEFPSEGTRELYLGSSESLGRILLLEPIS